MPKPTQGIDVDTDPDPYNAAYEYNYLYDYPIGMYPMYFPIRNVPDLPKVIYSDSDNGVTSTAILPSNKEKEDYSIAYYTLAFVIALSMFVLLIKPL